MNTYKNVDITNATIPSETTASVRRNTAAKTKMLRVAIVSPYPPSKGTLNEYAYHLVEQFKLKNSIKELHLITDVLPKKKPYPSAQRPDNLFVHAVWSFNKLDNSVKIKRCIDSIKPDVVLYNLQFLSFGDKKIAATLGLMSPMISKWSGIPSMVLLHNIIETVDYQSAGITTNPILKKAYDMIGSQITKIILGANLVGVTMPKYVNILEKKYGCKNVALLPHGSFESTARPKFDYNPEKRNVLTFGKFGTYKKVENLIEALLIVRENNTFEIDLTIAGTDNPNVKGYLASVKEKYKNVPGLNFTGYVQEDQVSALFTQSTIVAFDYTSTTGSSGVLHQAGSYGKAVMLPNIGDLKELISEEGFRGEYFSPNSIPEMAAALEKLLVDDVHRRELGQTNYAAASGLPISDIADWYIMHFQSLANR